MLNPLGLMKNLHSIWKPFRRQEELIGALCSAVFTSLDRACGGVEISPPSWFEYATGADENEGW